jgi:hypothetical protein
LYGVVLLKGKNEALAKAWLLKSVNHCPWNWGAWQELADLLSSAEEVSVVNFLSYDLLINKTSSTISPNTCRRIS